MGDRGEAATRIVADGRSGGSRVPTFIVADGRSGGSRNSSRLQGVIVIVADGRSGGSRNLANVRGYPFHCSRWEIGGKPQPDPRDCSRWEIGGKPQRLLCHEKTCCSRWEIGGKPQPRNCSRVGGGAVAGGSRNLENRVGGGAVATQPGSLSAIEGPAQLSLGGRHQHWRKGCVRPSIRPVEHRRYSGRSGCVGTPSPNSCG